MKIPLINAENQSYATAQLNEFYKDHLIPAEKKAYLTDLEGSVGPYLGIESADGQTRYMLDAASQIATLGLGFNSSVLMGCSQFLETWTNDHHSETYKKIRLSFEKFLKRQSGWSHISASFCNSGAEANEMALGYCFKRRNNPKANKVLAFEGSFHGRMMVALNSTWNKSKREPFTLPGHETIFTHYPKLPDANIDLAYPQKWRTFWSESSKKEVLPLNEWDKDLILKDEVHALMKVREQLLSNKIFAIIIEPMQCEGGDRYASGRFHTALNLMAKSFQVPVIYDEVQTGFHLGRTFFWHTQFEMHDQDGAPLYPDYLVCAKKAQVGMVLSPHRLIKDTIEQQEQFSTASFIRGYLHALSLDQMKSRILQVEQWAKEELDKFLERYKDYTGSSRCLGLAFAFDLKNEDHVATFVKERFNYGMLYYPAGTMTLRFRLNIAFSKNDIQFLFSQLTKMAEQIFKGNESSSPKEVDIRTIQTPTIYEWQRLILKSKINVLKGSALLSSDMMDEIRKVFRRGGDVSVGEDLFVIDQNNYANYKKQIQSLQTLVYEPARQTTESRFYEAAHSPFGLCLGLKQGAELLGICFSSSLKDHPLEKALRRDPQFENPKALYILDTTIHPKLQGQGVGRQLKYALKLMAFAKGAQFISGRNRDKMAATMFNINLSLGSYQLFHIREDYLDMEPYRDVIYYTTPLNWEMPKINLSTRVAAPFGHHQLDEETLSSSLPFITNKMCLSNFVDKQFLSCMKNLLGNMPQALQHGYSTSGQSECVDKLAKSIWYSVHKVNKNLTFEGHFFGNGSFMSRSLSDSGKEHGFFPVDHLPHPDQNNWQDIITQVEQALKNNQYLAVWIEPITQIEFKKVPLEFLKELKKITKKYQVPLVYNESASQFYAYDKDHLYCANNPEIAPDAGIAYLGSQAGLVFMNKDIFVDKPLMMISTWDGDQTSFSLYEKSLEKIQREKSDYDRDMACFDQVLKTILKDYSIENIEIERGRGRFKGNISAKMGQYFRQEKGYFIVDPNWSMALDFIKEYSNE